MNENEKKAAKRSLEEEKRVLKKLKLLYLAALLELKEGIRDYTSDDEWSANVYQNSYQILLAQQISDVLDKLRSKEYETIKDYLEDSYTDGFVGAVFSMHGQDVPIIVPMDKDQIIRALTTNSQINGGLYEALGVDVDKLKQVIADEIARGIATNMSYGEIARNISERMNISLRKARRIVITEAHRIREEAAQDARAAAKTQGADVVKQWDATMDGKTRKTHRKLDGQVREINEPFEVDGKRAMHPGGFGRPEEDINCRCVALTRARWAMNEAELEILKQRAEFWGLDKTKDFEEFRRRFLDAVK